MLCHDVCLDVDLRANRLERFDDLERVVALNVDEAVDDGERRAASAAGVTMLRAGDYGYLDRRSSAFALRTAVAPGQPDNAGGQPLRTTQAFTASPHLGSGTPMTATSKTSGWP